MELVILVIISIVQSIFGVGVLLFGTPIFLLLGYTFFETLVFLLPISILISTMTLLQNAEVETERKSYFFLVLCIIAGTYFAIEKIQDLMVLIIALTLILTCIANFVKSEKINNQFIGNKSLAFSFIGLIHGLTNQGGALLLWFFNGQYSNKTYVRSNIALAYGIMACFQLITLFLIDFGAVTKIFNFKNLVIPTISFLIGSYIFKSVSSESYRRLSNIFIGIFGVCLLYKFIAT
jgi:hypothetical protein